MVQSHLSAPGLLAPRLHEGRLRGNDGGSTRVSLRGSDDSTLQYTIAVVSILFEWGDFAERL